MEQDIKDSGMLRSTKERGEEFKSGLTAASMKDIGKTIKQTEEEGSSMRTETFT